MMIQRLPSVLMLAGSLALPLTCASAEQSDDVAVLRDRLDRQEQIIERLEARLRELEARPAAFLSSSELSQFRGRGDPSSGTPLILAQASGTVNGSAAGSSAAPASRPSTQAAPNASAAASPAGQAPVTGQQAPEKKEGNDSGDDVRILARQPAVFDRKFSMELGYSYARFDRRQLALSGFYALDAIFLGTLSVDQLKGNTHNLDLTARYGLTETIGVDVQLPWTYRGNLYLSGGANNNPAQLTEERVKSVGQGDMSVGASWQVAREARAGADIVSSMRVRLPTGENPFGITSRIVTDANGELTSLKVPERLPTGQGFYSFQPGLSILKTYDPTVLFANLSFSVSPSRHFDDISAGSSRPGSVKPGSTVSFGFGMVLAMNDTTAFSLSATLMTTTATRTMLDGDSKWTRVVGSEGNAAILSLGVTHALTPKLSIVTSLGVGLTGDSPNYTVSFRFPYRF